MLASPPCPQKDSAWSRMAWIRFQTSSRTPLQAPARSTSKALIWYCNVGCRIDVTSFFDLFCLFCSCNQLLWVPSDHSDQHCALGKWYPKQSRIFFTCPVRWSFHQPRLDWSVHCYPSAAHLVHVHMKLPRSAAHCSSIFNLFTVFTILASDDRIHFQPTARQCRQNASATSMPLRT